MAAAFAVNALGAGFSLGSTPMKVTKPSTELITYKGRSIKLHALNKLPFCTVQLVFEGSNAGSATGFFFNFEVEGQNVPCLVTNAHVVEGADKASACFHVKWPGEVFSLGNVATGFFAGFEKGWLKHPAVDLAIFPFLGVNAQFRETAHENYGDMLWNTEFRSPAKNLQ